MDDYFNYVCQTNIQLLVYILRIVKEMYLYFLRQNPALFWFFSSLYCKT